MESFELQNQVEELLRELGVEPPAEEEEVIDDDDFECAMCGLGTYFSAVENAYLRQFIESAADDLRLADARIAAQHSAVVAVAAVAMELAVANPEWAERLLAQLPFDRDHTRYQARSIKDSFVE